MEEKQETLFVTTNNNSPKSPNQDGLLQKKKRDGPFQFVRVAMYKLRAKNEQSKPNQLQSTSTWKNVVGSMRPLHLQGDQSPIEAAPLDPKPLISMNNQLVEDLEVHTPPMSPGQQCSTSASSSCCLASCCASANDLLVLGRMSKYASTNALEDLGRTSNHSLSTNDLQELGRRRYASANDLQELLRSELKDNDDEYDEDEEDKYYDDKRGDEMIDFKAEEFIAKFYEQMRIQREAYGTKRC